MHGYRLTKYDPALRNAFGHFTGDDWTMPSQIGETFNGVVLTEERYLEVEQVHLDAVEAFAAESGVDRLALWTPGAYDPDPALLPAGLLDVLHDGYEVSLTDALTILRAMLRGEAFGCVMEADGRFVLHSGWDYYLYVTSHVTCENAVRRAHELGLFAEPFQSPYFDDAEEPYPPADDAFWARIDVLALHARRPIAVLEEPFRGRWHWHLVNVGQRPEMRQRATVEVYAGLTADRLVSPLALGDAGVRPDFQAVLPDADGVVRARWTL